MFDNVEREVEAVGFRIIVKPDPITKKTASGIEVVINERTAKASMNTGVLISIGPTAWKAFDDGTPWGKIGDRILYSKYAGKHIDDGSEDGVLLLNDEDMQGKIVHEEKIDNG